MIRIGIDCRLLTSSKPTGVSNYLADAINAFQQYTPNIEMFLFAPQPINSNTIELESSNIHTIICPLPLINKYLIWYNTMFVYQCRKFKVDYVWMPVPDYPLFLGKDMKILITVHDVVSFEYANTRRNNKLRRVKDWFSTKGINKAKFIWCNSRYTKDKVEQYFPHRKCHDIFTGFSCSEEFSLMNVSQKDKGEIKDRYGIIDKFLLFVGTLEPRKNLSFLLEIMEVLHIDIPSLKLVIVGGKGWKYSNIFKIINRPRYPKDSVVFTDYIDTATLIKLYNIADCYVSTSLNEGFGLPQLEAMKCGCPVVTAHNSAMIEVVSGRGFTVEGWNIKDWCNTIKKALSIDKASIKYDLSEYDWKNIVERVYYDITKGNRPCKDK